MRQIFLLSAILTLTGCPGEFPEPLMDQGRGADLPGLRDASADARGNGADVGAGRGDQAGPGLDTHLPHHDRLVADRTVSPPDQMIHDQWSHDGSLGKPCQGWQDCTDPYVCTTNTHTGFTYCTLFCDPCSADPCPPGTGCQPAGMGYYICALGYPNTPCP